MNGLDLYEVNEIRLQVGYLMIFLWPNGNYFMVKSFNCMKIRNVACISSLVVHI